ncbi:type II toxin-antitoxin system VapC family toxin [Brucella sp. IR073]|uniref:type II toxin-antitoxin system VapC family toxin n=1 Tax=unclassified Brucella TaxID=2632610 RepID=UPI003B984144
MISHLLDTNAVISLTGRKSDAMIRRVVSKPKGSIGLSSVVAFELYFGPLKSARIEYNLETVRLIMADFPVLDFDQNDAFVAGEIRAALAAKGRPIGPYDLLIAGQAKARGLSLVTNNTREFSRVENLRLEDWSL